MNVWTILENRQNFTDSEISIADYLFGHKEQIGQLQIHEVVHGCFISSATLYRLIAKLGCSGFSDLKFRLQKDLPAFLPASEAFDYDFPFAPSASHEEIADALHEDLQKTLQATRNLISVPDLQLSVQGMRKARRIVIFTSAGNVAFAQNFRFQMLEIGRDILIPIDEYEQRLVASTMGRQDFAILITFGGRGFLNEVLSNILHANKVPVLLISTSSLKKEDRHARYQLCLDPAENHYNKISSFSTRQSLLYVLDLLYCCYFSNHYQENLEYKLSSYQIIRNFSQKD